MNNTYSKEEIHSIRVGIYTILIIALLSVVYMVRRNVALHNEESSHYSLKARFGRTDGLSVGDPVRLAGVDIGKVIDAEIDPNYKAVLTLEIKDGINIPSDSSASIVSDGVLGSKYIEIEPGGEEEYIPDDGEFAYTQDAMVLEELLDRIIGIGKSKRKKDENVVEVQDDE
ncbi:MAG: MCE family protein [Alphaproteobacteria bacterium]|nr:MCE family protein [Alphaproteobacteria bacterium]